MERAQGRSGAALPVALGILLLLVDFACAATYIVGDSQGWDLNVNYAAWAGKKKFRAGDVLIFTYTQMHSVVEVSQADFATCTITPISTYMSGNDSVTLSSTKSKQFFICGTGGHCGSGMALQVDISPAAATVPAPAPAPRAKPPAPAAAKSPKSSSPAPKGENPVSTPSSTPSSPSPSSSSPADSTDETPPPAAPRGNSAVTAVAAAAGACWISVAIAALALF
ncbi:uclacyanin-3 [Selaginella moellendorffii]|nr:uclacyanin-3 [Selaginella moellendorffii]|eukprot:XP_002961476.2 uclacyanin-3 [Selaginella moellendorffii]